VGAQVLLYEAKPLVLVRHATDNGRENLEMIVYFPRVSEERDSLWNIQLDSSTKISTVSTRSVNSNALAIHSRFSEGVDIFRSPTA